MEQEVADSWTNDPAHGPFANDFTMDTYTKEAGDDEPENIRPRGKSDTLSNKRFQQLISPQGKRPSKRYQATHPRDSEVFALHSITDDPYERRITPHKQLTEGGFPIGGQFLGTLASTSTESDLAPHLNKRQSSGSPSSNPYKELDLVPRLNKRRPKWSGFFCKITCGSCKERLNIQVAALCQTECQRGVGDSYMACLVTMAPGKITPTL